MKKGIVLILCCILLWNLGGCKKEMIVGKDIKKEDITEFYDTYSTSTFPPEYQRYYFYVKDGKPYFYHEKREGEVWPLTEEYATEKGTKELTQEEWDTFYSLISNGVVKEREESVTSGDSGPWFYLYWKNDKGKYQEYSFETYAKEKEFEQFCIELKEKTK